jgi:hypothetical protein
MSRWCRSAISPNERLQYRLHPCTSFVIVPLFALANVGIHIDGHLIGEAIASPITPRDRRWARWSAQRWCRGRCHAGSAAG